MPIDILIDILWLSEDFGLKLSILSYKIFIEKYFKILLRGSKVYLWYKFAFLLQNILQLTQQIKQSLFNNRLGSNFLDQGCRVTS